MVRVLLIVARGRTEGNDPSGGPTRRFLSGSQRKRTRRHVASRRDHMRVCARVRCLARFFCCLSLCRVRETASPSAYRRSLIFCACMHAHSCACRIRVLFKRGNHHGVRMVPECHGQGKHRAVPLRQSPPQDHDDATTEVFFARDWVSFDTTEVSWVCAVRFGNMQPTSSPALLRPMLSHSPASCALSRYKRTHTHTACTLHTHTACLELSPLLPMRCTGYPCVCTCVYVCLCNM